MNMASPISSPSGPVVDDSFEDACSICLEPFTSFDPPFVTKCKHEYHLQCILEWSQRRNECPLCSQHLVLTDPISQELLFGVDNEVNNDAPHGDEPDFEQRIMRHFTGIASRARNISRKGSQSPSDSPGRSTSSEFVAFSESLKSKISTASIRYRESISKSTSVLKEKLVAHNDSVRELRIGVQREVSAGIAGVARMIDRLDITHKRAGISVPSSSFSNSNSGVAEISLAKEKN